MTISAANDNWPKVYTVGLGNKPWRVNEQFGRLTAEEVTTVSRPLHLLHEIVVQAMEVMRAESSARDNCAVYVIGDVYGRECKIGKATNPASRRAQLQTGNPNELFLHRVFWMPRRAADAVEIEAHRIAGDICGRLEGEWFKCGPSEAHEIIESAIQWVGGVPSYCVMTPPAQLMEVAA